MNISFIDGQSITLEQMLIAKEQRVIRQHNLIKQYQLPIISLTLVIPGAIKKSSGSDYLFNEAIFAIDNYLKLHHIEKIKTEYIHLPTGSEAVMVLDCLPEVLKAHCIDIEEQHILGRLWDIDVIEPVNKTSISRTAFDHNPRLCLVCQHNAKACSRSRRHTLDDIFSSMTYLINKHATLLKGCL